MRECVKNKWIAALRSGKYKQGRGRLNGPDGYCCLGVLCEVFIADGNALDVRTPNSVTEYNGESSYPPDAVLKWAGIRSLEGHAEGAPHSVAAVNDHAHSFTSSIEYIEQHWKNM
jgi:hypothetical protein